MAVQMVRLIRSGPVFVNRSGKDGRGHFGWSNFRDLILESGGINVARPPKHLTDGGEWREFVVERLEARGREVETVGPRTEAVESLRNAIQNKPGYASLAQMDAAAGDARLAIGILRTAASKADRENHEQITDDILLDTAEDARAKIKQKSLDSLTPHQRVIYNIVRDHGPLGPSEIHDRYMDEVDDPRTKRTVRTYLSKMAQYNLLEAEDTSRDREYSIVNSTAASAIQ